MPSYKRLLTASAKGGVGKSTTALMLASQYALSGKKTLLADFDMTSRSLDILTGCENKSAFDFSDYSRGASLESCVIKKAADIENLDLLRACTEDAFGTDGRCGIASAAGRLFCEAEERGYEIIVCDTGGGIGEAEVIAPLVDMVLVTSEQGQASLRAAEYAASRLKSAGADAIRLVICSFDLRAVKRERRAGIIEMIDRSSLRCAGVVPLDKNLRKMQDGGIVPRKGNTAEAYKNIKNRLEGADVPLFCGMKKLRKRISEIL